MHIKTVRVGEDLQNWNTFIISNSLITSTLSGKFKIDSQVPVLIISPLISS